MTVNELQKELFKFKDWTIRKWTNFEGSCVIHDPCEQPMESLLLDTKPKCYNCDVPVPEEVLCVWVMLNFERIQKNQSLFKAVMLH